MKLLAGIGTASVTHVMQVETTRDEFDPHVSSDGLDLYWAPIQTTGGQHLVFASRPTRTSDFAIVRNLDEINDGAAPATSPDELVITMSVGVPSDVNYATRANKTDMFGT